MEYALDVHTRPLFGAVLLPKCGTKEDVPYRLRPAATLALVGVNLLDFV